MKSLVSLGSCAVLLLLAWTGAAVAADRSADTDPDLISGQLPEHLSAPGDADAPAMSKANGDTLILYGGPGTIQGKFQDPLGVFPSMDDDDPQDGIPDWTGSDITDLPVFWQRETFNAENLNNNGPGNHAMWCGQTAAQQPGWASAPGYGNSWFDIMVFTTGPLANPGVGQTVSLDFFFNHDTEPGYDFFLVEYDSFGAWTEVYAEDGSNKEPDGTFLSPGVRYSTTGAAQITFVGSDYGGDNNDEIRIRMIVSSDSGWSDEDGDWITDAGAVQVDDISVGWMDGATPGTSFEGFEGSEPFEWTPEKAPFAGDFTKVFPRFDDIDPCVDNRSPMVGFVDDGTPPSNALWWVGPARPYANSTSPNWTYGVPGGYVVNYQGGVSLDVLKCINAVVSPPIAWDHPSTVDDGDPAWAGAIQRHTVWGHSIPVSGIRWSTWVRSSVDDGVSYNAWQWHTGVWGASLPAWYQQNFDISEVLTPGLTHLQVALVFYDVSAIWGLPGTDATPTPVFDNFTVKKYRLPGPVISRDWVYSAANDGFPVGGSIDVSTEAARDALDIPFDRVSDVSGDTAAQIWPGDSLTVDIQAKIPGTTVVDHRMIWMLDRNPLFDDVRVVPARVGIDENVETTVPGVWTGEVVGRESTTSAGTVVEDRFFYDLPDEDFMYPGDKLRYYIQASDDLGGLSTFPANTDFFPGGTNYNGPFAIKGLPSIRDDAGTQPRILVVNQFGYRGALNEYWSAFGQNGYVEGVDYDIYTVTRADNNWNSNGIGAAGAHGANADQLINYEVIFYEAGVWNDRIMCDGSNDENNMKCNDVGVMTAWLAQPRPRAFIGLGDNFAEGASTFSGAGQVFVENQLGVDYVDTDVRDEIGGEKAPIVRPIQLQFGTEYVAYGSCPGINQFDAIRAIPPAVRGHGFVNEQGSIIDDFAASVVFEREVDGFTKTSIVLPYSMMFVYSVNQKAGSPSTNAIFVDEILDSVGNFPPSSSAVGTAPSRLPFSDFRQFPNPFNPATTIAFTLGKPADTSVRIYTLRGELVRELHSGELGVGPHEFVWKGVDHSGSTVASGVYLIEVKGPGFDQAKKAALVR